uniref:CDP-diacylglycerol--glycerol-3-phosphate 3-phosphatidyltransferase n=1 Tax=Meloidogyne javanica TaxID=6303 RepID=A0A915N421_MELJA
MSVSWGTQYAKLKTNLRLAANRLRLLQKKKTEQAIKARTEIAEYLNSDKEDRARIRVETIIREDFVVEAYELLEIDELTHKYGKQFAEAARMNQLPEPSRVSPKLVQKLSVNAPSKLLVEKYLITIAQSAGIDFTPDPKVMRDDDDEVARAERNLINFMNEEQYGWNVKPGDDRNLNNGSGPGSDGGFSGGSGGGNLHADNASTISSHFIGGTTTGIPPPEYAPPPMAQQIPPGYGHSPIPNVHPIVNANAPIYPQHQQHFDHPHYEHKRISSSKSRIVFAALYLGTGQKEQQIVSRLQTACSENEELEVSFLLDYFRGTRGEPNDSSTSILKPLLENKNVQIFRANLSDQYFDNRQDRYLVVENCPRLADFFHSIYTIMAKHSMQLDKFGKLNFSGSASIHPFTGSNEEIQKSIKTEIFELFDKCKGDENIKEINLITAYFNLCDEYADWMLQKRSFLVNIVFGSPRTNGFYGGTGLSGSVPLLYLQNSLDFIRKSKEKGFEKSPFTFMEWDRDGWTFHAKGLWIDFLNSKRIGTVLGSSNYGFRSSQRDLEAQVLLVTENDALKKKIIEERQYLLEHAQSIEIDAFLKREILVSNWNNLVFTL